MHTIVDGTPDPELYARLTKAPVSTVRWVKREQCKPNDYNPNKVAPPELELLIVSILEDGFTQPIVVLPDLTIVDGFHRWTVANDPRIAAIYGGYVPVVEISVDPVHRKMSTVRHNRARGVHGVMPMADMVRGMIEDGVEPPAIMRGLGMEPEEVERLADRSGMPERVVARAGGVFSKEWKPVRV